MSSQLAVPECDLALVTLAFEGGGPERDSVFLCNALAAKGIRVAILALRGDGPLRSLVDPDVHVVDVLQPRMRYGIFGLRRAIRTLAPAIVVSSGIPSLNLITLLAVRALPRGQRPKLILREIAVPSMAHQDPSRSNRIAYRVLHYLYRYADRIITLTDGARRDLTQKFSVPDGMISVMHVNPVIPPAMVQKLAQWDGETGRERDLVVCVGRLSREKDHRTLLRAVSLIPSKYPWQLAIVGDGPERAALETFARNNGLADRTVFTGYVADPFAWMMRARAVVLSSIYEGLGCVIIEALACGTPVVCTDCPYGPRVILQGGRFGTLTPVGDPVAMAVALTAALDSIPDRRLLMKRGLEFTSERAAERFLRIAAEVEPRLNASKGSLRRGSGAVDVAQCGRRAKCLGTKA